MAEDANTFPRNGAIVAIQRVKAGLPSPPSPPFLEMTSALGGIKVMPKGLILRPALDEVGVFLFREVPEFRQIIWVQWLAQGPRPPQSAIGSGGDGRIRIIGQGGAARIEECRLPLERRGPDESRIAF